MRKQYIWDIGQAWQSPGATPAEFPVPRLLFGWRVPLRSERCFFMTVTLFTVLREHHQGAPIVDVGLHMLDGG
jgi:hypothetical protein